MSRRLKRLLETAANYFLADQWPPVVLVKQIEAEAEQVGIQPLKYHIIDSPDTPDIHGGRNRYFDVVPETDRVLEYQVRDPFRGIKTGVIQWYKRGRRSQTVANESCPSIQVIEVIPVIPRVQPERGILCAIQAWIAELEFREQPLAPVSPAPAAATPQSAPPVQDAREYASIVGAIINLWTPRVGNETINHLVSIVKSDATVDEKLTELNEVLRIPPTASIRQLAALLGCSDSAVHKTSWWKQNRRGSRQKRVAEREERLRECGKRYEL